MTPLELELRATLRADPDDRRARLLLAELLVERGDPLGEQLVLEDQVQFDETDWKERAERLLRLSAARGFARIDDPDARLVELGWHGGGSYPVQYDGRLGDQSFYVRYRHGGLSVSPDAGLDPFVELDLDLVDSGDWNIEETNVILHCISDAIIEGRLAALTVPPQAEMLNDPRYRPGPCPSYSAHPDFASTERYLGARDHARWWALYERWSKAT